MGGDCKIMNTYTDSVSHAHHIYLYGEIEDPDKYVDMIHLISAAGPYDEIIIHINSVGGNLDTTVSLVSAIRNSRARVITIAEGFVYSGASLVFFSGEEMGVNEFADFLIHDAQAHYRGKMTEQYRCVTHERDYLRDFYLSVYKPFFTEEEIDEVLDGKDLMIRAEQVEERIKRVSELELNPGDEEEPSHDNQ